MKRFLSAVLAIILTAGAGTTQAATVFAMETGDENQASSQVSAFAVGPGLDNLSSKDAYASYQWGLRNDGQVQKMERKLNIKSLDSLYVHRSEKEIDSIALPPLGPSNFETISTKAVKGIDINIQPAWKHYNEIENKRSVIVAVIDTGIDASHPDLEGSMWVNTGEIPGDGIDNDGNGYVDDIHGWNALDNNAQIFAGDEDTHGTHAAGTIAAKKDDGGIVGITDNNYVKIMSLKALGGAEGKGTPESVIAAIKYAEANGAQICNLSFGSLGCSPELEAAIRDSSMLFVVAAGNGNEKMVGYDIDKNPVYPASLPYNNVITVANLMFDGQLDTSSNYGAASVDIAAPGVFIVSTIPGKSYGFMTGTSMAAPMVTGVAAMVYSGRPELSLLDVKNIIITSAHKLDSLTGKILSGGMVDADAALQWGRS